ncbi:terpene synthase family protein [Nocardia wallacei]|uniref:terpene synthase family protein n=1 Tax=Nocardia wallacei TaxID=480035 RepID=UPI0024554E97|nr:terpene synthase family protein [Nocardia wallacei]
MDHTQLRSHSIDPPGRRAGAIVDGCADPKLAGREQVLLPEFEIRLPFEANPFQDRIIPVRDRLADLGVPLDETTGTCVARVASLMHPRIGLIDLQLVADIFGFFFAYDDQFDGPLGWDETATAETVENTKKVFSGHVPDQTSDPFNYALMHLWEQIRQRASAELWERIVTHTLGWLDHYRWETALRCNRRIATVTEQRRERFWASEMSFDWEYIELTEAPFLPRRFIRHPVIQQTLTDCTLIVAWWNDICSLARENPYNNIVYCIQQDRSCGLQAAIDIAYHTVVDLCDTVLARQPRLPDLLETLRLDPRETARAHAWSDSLLLSTGGALRWHVEPTTGRYCQQRRQNLPSLRST